MTRFWRWLFPETPADKLRREAWAVVIQQREVAWMLRREFFELEVKKAAAMGRFTLNVLGADVDLFAPNAPGDRWARSMGFEVGRDGLGHGYAGSWPMIRWDR